MLSMWVDLSRVIYSFDCKSLTPLWSQNWGFEGNCYTTKVWTWFGFWLAYMCETTWVTLNRKRENLLWTLMLQEKLQMFWLVHPFLTLNAPFLGSPPSQTQCCSNTLPGQNLDPLLRECARLISNGAGSPSWKVLQVWVVWVKAWYVQTTASTPGSKYMKWTFETMVNIRDTASWIPKNQLSDIS